MYDSTKLDELLERLENFNHDIITNSIKGNFSENMKKYCDAYANQELFLCKQLYNDIIAELEFTNIVKNA